MICPKCQGEMLEGYYPTPGLRWVPKYGRTHLSYKGRPPEEGFWLTAHTVIRYCNIPAWFCRECDILLIDRKEPPTPQEWPEW